MSLSDYGLRDAANVIATAIKAHGESVVLAAKIEHDGVTRAAGITTPRFSEDYERRARF